jgi:hypothetical protein
MSSFDPMAAAIDWLDAYRAASLSIVEFYAHDAELECGCGGIKELHGRLAITEYWRQRFVEEPAGELVDLQPAADAVLVSYQVTSGVVQVFLRFDGNGKIRRSVCGPPAAGQKSS